MYNTVKEIHVAMVSRLMQINSERKHTFKHEELDYVFNDAMLAFIEERSVITPNPNGLFETVKRYDDLKDLNVVDKIVKIIFSKDTYGNKKVFCYLPIDYYKYQDLSLHLNYDCFRKDEKVENQEIPMSIYKLDFPTPQVASEYSTFKIEDTFNSQILYESSTYKLDDLKNPLSKFMIVNSVLENVSRNFNLEIYWETFGTDIYEPNSFIIIQPYQYQPNHYTLTVGTTNKISTQIDRTYYEFDYISPITLQPDVNLISNVELVQTNKLKDVKNNYYMYKNRHLKPLVVLEKWTVNIDYNPKYVPLYGRLSYIKRPVFINYKAEIMTDFKSHISEIIDLAVTRLNLILNGGAEASIAISKTNQQY